VRLAFALPFLFLVREEVQNAVARPRGLRECVGRAWCRRGAVSV
jgi:hypothetical protein